MNSSSSNLTLAEKQAAFEAVYDRLFPHLYAYLAARLGRAQDAEDLTSETFLKAAKNLHRFEPRFEGSMDAWLFSIAANLVKNFYRSDDRQGVVLSLDELPALGANPDEPEHSLAKKERFLRLRRILQTLSPRYQEVITLKFYGGLRNREIAAALGLEERTVAAYLVRGLRQLQARYELPTTESDEELP